MFLSFKRVVKVFSALAGGVLAVAALTPLHGASAMSAATGNGAARSYTHGANIVRLVNNHWATNPGHVYNQYYRIATPTTRKSYGLYGGGGKYIDSMPGSRLIDLRACETILAWPDNCSPWAGSH